MSDSQISDRKLEHIRIVLEEEVEPLPSPFARYRLPYRALPNLNLDEVDASTEFLGSRLSMPLIISSMTGGPEAAAHINKNLATAAEEMGVALALGSMRICLQDAQSGSSFKVRHLCPNVPLLANIGLVQLNYGVGVDQIKYLIDLVEADGLYLHLNALQEAVQPEGDTAFKGLVDKLTKIIPQLPVPVLAKEVGAGIDTHSAKVLLEAGVQWIDVAGTGGTSWAQVEGHRRQDRLGHVFRALGIPTDEALVHTRDIDGIRLIASGGIRNGLELATAITLGAKIGASAKPFLAPALDSADDVCAEIRQWKREFEVAMFATGSANLEELAQCVSTRVK